MTYNTVYPRPLRCGDRIAIVSPASIINPDYLTGAARVIEAQGWEPVIAPSALGKYGSYSAPSSERLADLRSALTDPSVRAILCARGGYGCVHLLGSIETSWLLKDPKWLIGFSDVSALHALTGSVGIASVHGPMCKQLSLHGADDPSVAALFSILRGEEVKIPTPPHPFNRQGIAEGRLIGGNLAVLDGLAATPFDPMEHADGAILFIEDIAEPIYKVERILWRLRLSGVFEKISALIVGQFTEWQPDRNYTDIYRMIADMTAPYTFPVAFGFPAGHVDLNLPLLLNAPAHLSVTSTSAILTQTSVTA